jgi:hypothetical protein
MRNPIYSPLRPLNLILVLAVGLVTFAAITFAQSRELNPKPTSTGLGTSGQWTADVKNAAGDEIQFNLRSSSDNGRSEYSSGRTVKVSDFQGLNLAEITAAAKTNVSFSLVREAGTINCEGTFSQGLGAAFWKFVPNASFVSAMQSRGYNKLTDADLVRAAFSNLTIKYTDELRTAGYDKITFDDLARAANHQITTGYINELRSAGYGGVTMDDVIRASNHEIDANYLNNLREMGFEKVTLDDAIRARNHEIDKNFIDSMTSAGFEKLSLDDLIRLKNHEISLSYVAELKSEGISNVSADNVIRAKNHDITGDLIRRAKAQGYTNASLDEIITLNNRGLIK